MSDQSERENAIIPDGFQPFLERSNHSDDNTGLMDHVQVDQDGTSVTVTNFLLMQEAFRNARPSKRLHLGGAWSESAKASNRQVAQEFSDGSLTRHEKFCKFIVGVYIEGSEVLEA